MTIYCKTEQVHIIWASNCIILWDIYPRELKTYSHVKTYTWIFITILFLIARIYKTLKCSSVSKWLRDWWWICIMKYYLAIKSNCWYNFSRLVIFKNSVWRWKILYSNIPICLKFFKCFYRLLWQILLVWYSGKLFYQYHPLCSVLKLLNHVPLSGIP